MLRFLGRYSAACYFTFKGFALLILWAVTVLNGGIDLLSGEPITVDLDLLLYSAVACFPAAGLFAWLESFAYSQRQQG